MEIEEQHRAVLALLGKPDLTVRVGATEQGSLQHYCWALLQELAKSRPRSNCNCCLAGSRSC